MRPHCCNPLWEHQQKTTLGIPWQGFFVFTCKHGPPRHTAGVLTYFKLWLWSCERQEVLSMHFEPDNLLMWRALVTLAGMTAAESGEAEAVPDHRSVGTSSYLTQGEKKNQPQANSFQGCNALVLSKFLSICKTDNINLMGNDRCHSNVTDYR